MIFLNRTIKFAENLKYYRTKYNLTQKQLAEQIGYTEKSVSQWERGNALPTMEIFLKLAQVFKISLDELMFEKTSGYYFLGIDGGGTKTAFKLVDENNNLISKTYKGSSNPNDVGMENAVAVLKEGINEVCGGIPYSKITMFAGLSGGGLTGDNNKRFGRFFSKFGFYSFENGSDIENLVALSNYDKCVLVIMGTGFIVYALNGDVKQRISGWGQFFDDGGSGYTLGRDAITAVLCASDGSGEKTMLTNLLEERLGETAQMHLARFYEAGKKYIADFSQLVFVAAKQGDKVANEILEKNMCFVANKIDTAVKFLKENSQGQTIPVLFTGGISNENDVLFPLIEKHVTQRSATFENIREELVEGAVIKAKRLFEEKENIKNENK